MFLLLRAGNNAQVEVSIQEASFRERFDIRKTRFQEYTMYLMKTVNYEDRSLYSFTMRAHDMGVPILESSATVRISFMLQNAFKHCP